MTGIALLAFSDPLRKPTRVGGRRRTRHWPPERVPQVIENTGPTFGPVCALHARMTHPRMVLQGDTSMVTRRTLRRHHLFRPDPAIAQLYLYTLGVCAKEFGIQLHAFVLMSTHEHLVLTDTNKRLPDFLRRLHRLVALGTKVLRKWEGPVWDHGRSSVVRLLTERAVIEKMAYVLANPVQALLALGDHFESPIAQN
jgi:hypothetical protein